MRVQAACSKSAIARMFFLVLSSMFLPWIKLAILRRKVKILLASILTNLFVLNKEIGRVAPF